MKGKIEDVNITSKQILFDGVWKMVGDNVAKFLKEDMKGKFAEISEQNNMVTFIKVATPSNTQSAFKPSSNKVDNTASIETQVCIKAAAEIVKSYVSAVGPGMTSERLSQEAGVLMVGIVEDLKLGLARDFKKQ